MTKHNALSEKSEKALELIAQGRTYAQIVAAHPTMTYLDIFGAAREALKIVGALERSQPEKPRDVPERYGEPWSDTEDRLLMELYLSGQSDDKIAKRLKRTSGAVRMRICRIRNEQAGEPRILGPHPADDRPIRLVLGRYGPFVSHGDDFCTVPRDAHPGSVTVEQAIEWLERKRKQ